MPFVNIRIVREVIAADPERKKAAIADKVANAISEVAGVGKDDIWVVFEEVAARDWYVGTTSVECGERARSERLGEGAPVMTHAALSPGFENLINLDAPITRI